jgi:membrane associated rhomboid family serine protease
MGASGAVDGLLFFCMIDNTLQIFSDDDNREKIFQYIITCLVIPCLVMSIFFDVDISGRTDHAAHIGGVIMGILVGIYLCPIPKSLIRRMPYEIECIQLIVLLLIICYFLITLLIFYLFIPVYLK